MPISFLTFVAGLAAGAGFMWLLDVNWKARELRAKVLRLRLLTQARRSALYFLGYPVETLKIDIERAINAPDPASELDVLITRYETDLIKLFIEMSDRHNAPWYFNIWRKDPVKVGRDICFSWCFEWLLYSDRPDNRGVMYADERITRLS